MPNANALNDQNLANFTITTGNLLMDNTNAGGTTGIIEFGSLRFISNFGTDNTFVGQSSGNNNLTTGSDNTAVGFQAFAAASITLGDTPGSFNVAVGSFALNANTVGSGSVAVGSSALRFLADGGLGANTAVGANALMNIVSGASNVAIGNSAGSAYTNLGESFNINVGAGVTGVIGDGNTIRIGVTTGVGSATACFIAGIHGTMVSGGGGIAVLCNGAGQLGTSLSSIRYKKNVQVMAEESKQVLDLSPVTFEYKNDATERRQFGLIAEDVEKIFPDLVIYNDKDEPESVQYHTLPVLLLDEIKKLSNEIRKMNERIRILEE